MDYAFSHIKMETLSVEEFLELDGDSGYLIGRNLITCDECRGNVFLKRGEKVKPHFAHHQFKESNKGCTLRVGKYTPQYVRQLRVKQSKLRVGYFQQRFEDLIFLTIIEMLEKNKKPFLIFTAIEGNKDSGFLPVKINNKNKLKVIDELRFLLTNFDPNKNPFIDALKKQFRTYSKDLDNEFKEDFFRARNVALDGGDFRLKDLDFTNNEDNFQFAKETCRHLNNRGTDPLFKSLYISALYLFLNIELQSIHKTFFNFEYITSDLSKNEFGDFFDLEHLEKILFEKNIPIHLKFNLLFFLRAFEDIKFKKPKKDISALVNKFSSEVVDQELSKKESSEMWEITYQEFLVWVFRVFSFTDLSAIARRNYGDNMQTPDEVLFNSTDKNRGFIYIAWTPYGKDMWESQLKAKGLPDALKIGRSDDPERRKKEIAGNFAPPDSLELVDYHPVMDMKKAERFVHSKLNKYRLSSNREVFGLDKSQSIEILNKIILQYQKSNEPTISSKGGFG